MSRMRLLLASLTLFAATGCGPDARPAAPAEPGAESVQDSGTTRLIARAADVATYQHDFLPRRTEFATADKSAWVAIAEGHVLPAASLEAADAAARKAAPEARHRFIFQMGEEGDVEMDIGGCELPEILGTHFLALLERDDVAMRFSTKHPSIQWRHGDTLTELAVPKGTTACTSIPRSARPARPGSRVRRTA
jgi:hypothetical protein